MKKKIKTLATALYQGGKSAWKKYHFIIPPKILKRYVKFLSNMIIEQKTPFYNPSNIGQYNKWLQENPEISTYKTMKYCPLISVLIPVYNVDAKYLKECIDSILAQKYDNFEICIVDDASTKKNTLSILEEYRFNNKIKIKHRKTNGHISRATNDALRMAKGEFVVLMDNDDVIPENALYEVVKVLNNNRDIDVIYTDEDKIDENGNRCNPHFKPDWSPETLMSLNYICHLLTVRTTLVRQVGGFTIGLEGAQDYDLLLRITEKTNNIYHIPKILYHWRMTASSTAQRIENKEYAEDNGRKAIEKAISRRKLNAIVEPDLIPSYYRVYYKLEKEPLVSIIIPIKDHARTTDACLKSIYSKTTYKNFEILLVNNRSEKKETYNLLTKYENHYKNFRIINADMEFNYSKINNFAVKYAKGTVVVLLNNDTQIISPDWLQTMVGYSVRPDIGAVGAKLFYPDDTIQHVGVVLGLGGVAGHSFLNMDRYDLGLYGLVRVPYNVGAVTAACLCVEKKKFEKVGGLNEDLKVAFNDVDFNMELTKAGYRNVILPMVELYHYESKSRGLDTEPGKVERFRREIDYMQHKWKKQLICDAYYNPNLSLQYDHMLDKKKENE